MGRLSRQARGRDRLRQHLNGTDAPPPAKATIAARLRDLLDAHLPDTPTLNLAFDVTPADLVTAIVTEDRLVRPAAGERMA